MDDRRGKLDYVRREKRRGQRIEVWKRCAGLGEGGIRLVGRYMMTSIFGMAREARLGFLGVVGEIKAGMGQGHGCGSG